MVSLAEMAMVPMRKDMLPATFFPPFDRLLPAAESGHVGRLIRSSEAVRNDDLGGNRWQFAYAV